MTDGGAQPPFIFREPQHEKLAQLCRFYRAGTTDLACAHLATNTGSIGSSEDEFPSFAHKISAQAVVRLFFDQPIPFPLVKASCGYKNVIGPKNNSAVSAGSRKERALVYQTFPQAQASTCRVNEEKTKLCGIPHSRILHNEDAPHGFSL